MDTKKKPPPPPVGPPPPAPQAQAQEVPSPERERERGPEAGRGDYNPFEHRDLKHPTNETESLIHLLKGSIGSGILGMPKAVMNGGLWLSMACTPVVGFVCTYCVQMLVASAHELYYREKVPVLDFSEVAELAFKTGPKRTRGLSGFVRQSVNWLMSINLLGTCCIYLVFIASNMKQVLEFHGYATVDLRAYIACTLPFLWILVIVRDLKYLSPTSMLANLLIIVGMIVSFYYMLTDIPSTSERRAVGQLTTIPLYFSTVIFALEGIGVVMPLENNMKDSRRFIGCPGVLSTGMSVVTILYSVVGFCGYLKYGDATADAITLNLPTAEPLAQSVKIMMSIAIYFTYFLQFYVPFQIIRKALERRWGELSVRNELILRLVMATCTVLVAVVVPTLEVFMSLIGAVCLASLGLVLPPLIETVVLWDKQDGLGRFNWRLYKNATIGLFGVAALLLGTATSIKSLIDFYTTDNGQIRAGEMCAWGPC